MDAVALVALAGITPVEDEHATVGAIALIGQRENQDRVFAKQMSGSCRPT